MLAELALEPRGAPAVRFRPRAAKGRGLRIVQVFMQGWIDSGLTRAGAGDAGGIATLLVHLGAALAGRPEVEEVVTLARGAGPPERLAHGARIERVPFGGDGPLASTDTWPHRRELERGLEARSAGWARSTRSTCASPTWRASARRASASGSGCRTSSRSRPTRTRSSAAASWRTGSTATASCRPTGASTCSSAPASSSVCATARPASPCCPAPELATSWPSSSGWLDRHRLVRTVPEGVAIEALDAAGRRRVRRRPGHPAARDGRRRPAAGTTRASARPLGRKAASRQGLRGAPRGVGGRPGVARRGEPGHRRRRPRTPERRGALRARGAPRGPRPPSRRGRRAAAPRAPAAPRRPAPDGRRPQRRPGRRRARRRLRLREREGGVRAGPAGSDGSGCPSWARTRAGRRCSSPTAPPARSPTRAPSPACATVCAGRWRSAWTDDLAVRAAASVRKHFTVEAMAAGLVDLYTAGRGA